jgi:hypothetical protein
MGVDVGGADPEPATAVATWPADQLLNASVQPMKRGDHRARGVDRDPLQRRRDPDALERGRLAGQPHRLDEHEAAQVRADPPGTSVPAPNWAKQCTTPSSRTT